MDKSVLGRILAANAFQTGALLVSSLALGYVPIWSDQTRVNDGAGKAAL